MESIYHNNISVLKFFLILGVVWVHSNLLVYATYMPVNEYGAFVIRFVSVNVSNIAVPCFFIVSGFLFFRGVTAFSKRIYADKLKRRVLTLLVPYLLWNLIALTLELVKINLLGYQSHGLIENGKIIWWNVAIGFFDYTHGCPYAFAFWYIRNLMVFVVISPVAYYAGVWRKWIFATVILLSCVANTIFYGFILFVMGGFISRHYSDIIYRPKGTEALIGGIIVVAIALAETAGFVTERHETVLQIVKVLGGFVALNWLAGKCDSECWLKVAASSFFIYALHQLFCSLIGEFYIRMFSLDSFGNTIAAFSLTFLSLSITSFVAWMILRRLSPGVVRVLSGARK